MSWEPTRVARRRASGLPSRGAIGPSTSSVMNSRSRAAASSSATAERIRASSGLWSAAWSQMDRNVSTSRGPTWSGSAARTVARVDREPHGGHEEVLLLAEVVVDQGRVDPGQLGHVADGGPLIALLGERPPGRVQDPLPGPAHPGPPAGPRPPPSSCSPADLASR